MKPTSPAWLLVLACHLAPAPALAQARPDAGNEACPQPLLNLVGRHAGVKALAYQKPGFDPGAGNGGLVAAVCKAWPGDPSRTIAAVAYDDGSPEQKALIVALLAPASGRVLASFDGSIQEDAAMTVGPGSLRIDTARYQLAPGVRAFGVDTASSRSHGCVDGGLGPTRTLFVQEGTDLRPVLEGMTVSSWRYLRGGPSCAPGQEGALIERSAYEIAIGSSRHAGFADLQVSARRVDSKGARRVRKPASVELHYDGQRYRVSALDKLF